MQLALLREGNKFQMCVKIQIIRQQREANRLVFKITFLPYGEYIFLCWLRLKRQLQQWKSGWCSCLTGGQVLVWGLHVFPMSGFPQGAPVSPITKKWPVAQDKPRINPPSDKVTLLCNLLYNDTFKKVLFLLFSTARMQLA